jgi:hypothetical protein
MTPQSPPGVEDAAFRAGYANGMADASQNLQAAQDQLSGWFMRTSRVSRMLELLGRLNWQAGQNMLARKGRVYGPVAVVPDAPAKDRGFV